MTELSWKHHTLIQALLSRGPLTEVDFHEVFKGITGKSAVTNQQVFDDFLLKINKALSYVQFELRCCRNQYDGRVYFGVVNNISDEQSKMGTKYLVPQIAFYKAIIEAIVLNTTAQGSISNISALNLQLEIQVPEGASQSQGGRCAALRNFSLSQKEKAIEELINDQWLKRTPDDNIALGMRSFLDLRSWFRNNEVPSCEACNEAGVKAELCQNEDCTARIHLYCLKKFFSQRKGGRVCPRCKTEWKFHGPNEDVVVKDENREPIASAPVPSERKGKRRRTNTTSEYNSQGGDSLQRRRVTRSYAHAR